jgi:hypothetical protein
MWQIICRLLAQRLLNIGYRAGADAGSNGHRRPRRRPARADGVDVFYCGPVLGVAAMEQTRKAYLSLYECAAVLAALALQIASLLALLQDHAAR